MRTGAVVFAGKADARVGELEMPPPQAGQVLIRTLLSTVSCGTEGWLLRNQYFWHPTRYPCVPGYQRVGEIIEIGPDVHGWKIGEKVMATSGQWNADVCPMWGSHAAAANTAAAELYRLPEGVDDIDASAAVVAQVGYNAANRIAASPGDWVAVFGDGLIGQCGAQAARARGLRAIVVGHRPARMRLAAQFSADAAVDGGKEDVVVAVRKLTGSNYVTAVIDAVHGTAVQEQYLPLLARGGQIVYSGLSAGETWANMAFLTRQELTAHFVSGWTRQRMEATLNLMSVGKMRIRPLITHLVSYRQAPEIWKMILGKQDDHLGVTFQWEEAYK